MRPTVRQRLYARLVPCTTPGCGCSGCLLIPTTGRYGQISVNGHVKLAHRVAWELDNEPIPEGVEIDHVYDRGCRHKNCVRVAHLEPVPRPVNIRRMDIANNGRQCRPRAPIPIDAPIPAPSPEAWAAVELLDRRLGTSAP